MGVALFPPGDTQTKKNITSCVVPGEKDPMPTPRVCPTFSEAPTRGSAWGLFPRGQDMGQGVPRVRPGWHLIARIR